MGEFITILKDAGLIIVISALLAKIKDKDEYGPYRLLFAVFLFLI